VVGADPAGHLSNRYDEAGSRERGMRGLIGKLGAALKSEKEGV
jgi:hypothetical protein